ncbi:MAG: hypothetical protein WD278_19655 [Pirellulales bacterium]
METPAPVKSGRDERPSSGSRFLQQFTLRSVFGFTAFVGAAIAAEQALRGAGAWIFVNGLTIKGAFRAAQHGYVAAALGGGWGGAAGVALTMLIAAFVGPPVARVWIAGPGGVAGAACAIVGGTGLGFIYGFVVVLAAYAGTAAFASSSCEP